MKTPGSALENSDGYLVFACSVFATLEIMNKKQPLVNFQPRILHFQLSDWLANSECLTIILRVDVGYEMVDDSQRGAQHQVGYNILTCTRNEMLYKK